MTRIKINNNDIDAQSSHLSLNISNISLLELLRIIPQHIRLERHSGRLAAGCSEEERVHDGPDASDFSKIRNAPKHLKRLVTSRRVQEALIVNWCEVLFLSKIKASRVTPSTCHDLLRGR